MPERDTMPLSPQEIATALVPEKVTYQFSPDFETLYVCLRRGSGGGCRRYGFPPLRCLRSSAGLRIL